jgi:hypothetical protein
MTACSQELSERRTILDLNRQPFRQSILLWIGRFLGSSTSELGLRFVHGKSELQLYWVLLREEVCPHFWLH